MPDGTRVAVVAGGFETKKTEILELPAGTWTEGPDLPFDIRSAASVQLEKTFLIVGGLSIEQDGQPLDTILRLNVGDDGTLSWEQLENVRLSQPKSNFAAFAVPDNFVECS